MNRNDSYKKRAKQRIIHTISFSGMYPPGGLIAWPDGSTSRIGERKTQESPGSTNSVKIKPFIATPEKNVQLMRA
ncbi:hypothetical protein HRH25_19555 [Flavisolibacter sp. BT320]|nr:hypothetical protein [Flavisolibacter longurius]